MGHVPVYFPYSPWVLLSSLIFLALVNIGCLLLRNYLLRHASSKWLIREKYSGLRSRFTLGVFFVSLAVGLLGVEFAKMGLPLAKVFALQAVGLFVFCLSYTDWKSRIVPNVAIYPMLVVAVVAGYLSGWTSLASMLIGGILGFVLLGLLHFHGKWRYDKTTFGMGDVKFFGALGFFFGYQGLLFILLGTVLPALLYGLIKKVKTRESSVIPLVSFSGIGIIFWVLIELGYINILPYF